LKIEVDLFVPCFVDQIFPNAAMNAVKVLEKVGCKVHYNPEQTCCGQPAFNAGFWDDAREVGTKFLNDFPNNRYIVSLSSSCKGMVANFYGELFNNSSLQLHCRQVQRNMYEFTEFLVNVLRVENLDAELHGLATYHDACSALRECNVKAEPRKLLSHVRGLSLVELAENETCCGFGGTFAVKYEPISSGMADQKAEYVVETQADFLVSADLSCLMHLQGYLAKRQAQTKVMYIADVLASGW